MPSQQPSLLIGEAGGPEVPADLPARQLLMADAFNNNGRQKGPPKTNHSGPFRRNSKTKIPAGQIELYKSSAP
jgi:hypothetical protein